MNLSVVQIGLNAQAAIGALRLSIMRLDPITEHEIVALPLRRRTLTPRVVRAGRDAQHTALRINRPTDLVRSHGFEDNVLIML